MSLVFSIRGAGLAKAESACRVPMRNLRLAKIRAYLLGKVNERPYFVWAHRRKVSPFQGHVVYTTNLQTIKRAKAQS